MQKAIEIASCIRAPACVHRLPAGPISTALPAVPSTQPSSEGPIASRAPSQCPRHCIPAARDARSSRDLRHDVREGLEGVATLLPDALP